MKVSKSYLLLFLFLISFAIYLPALKAPFFWDDEYLIPAIVNPLTSTQAPESRPLRALTFSIDSWLWQKNAAGYHFTNILLNSAACVAAFFFINMFFEDTMVSFFIALLFCLHPVHVETVAWIKNRTELLSFICFVAAFISFSKKRWVSYLAFLAMVLSKESAVVFPAVLTFYLYLYGRKNEIKDTMGFWAIALIRLAAGIVYAPHVLGAAPSITAFQHVLAVIKTYAFYFYLMVFPVHLNIGWLMDLSWDSIYSYLAAMVFTGYFILVYYVRKNRVYLFLAGLLIIFMLPYSNIVYLTGRPWAEQRLYLPVLAFSMITGAVLMSRKYLTYLFIPLVAFYGVRTFARVNQWGTPEVLWEQARETCKNSKNWDIEFNLGSIYYKKGEYAKAKEYLTRAASYNPSESWVAFNDLGLAFMKERNYLQAVDCLKKVIDIKPEYVPAYYNLGVVYLQSNSYREAVKNFEKARELSPKEPQIYNNLAVAYKDAGEAGKAIDALKEVLKMNPKYINAHRNLMLIYKDAGMKKEALDELNILFQTYPNDPAFIKIYQELKHGK